MGTYKRETKFQCINLVLQFVIMAEEGLIRPYPISEIDFIIKFLNYQIVKENLLLSGF